MTTKHKWRALTDSESTEAKAAYGTSGPAFFRACAVCGCKRRIDAIRNSRAYVPAGGRWSNAVAVAPTCTSVTIRPK